MVKEGSFLWKLGNRIKQALRIFPFAGRFKCVYCKRIYYEEIEEKEQLENEGICGACFDKIDDLHHQFIVEEEDY